MAVPAVTIEGLSKRYVLGKKRAGKPETLLERFRRREEIRAAKAGGMREVWALRDVSLSVKPGTILGVIGPNGAGKSTLLKVLARVTPPTAGSVRIQGRLVSLLEVGAGFQPEYTGRENVLLNAALLGIPRPDVEARMAAIVEFAELGKFFDVPVKRYSSGMYLRLAFSMAINLDPDVLLADEVLAVGDLAFQERCLQGVEAKGSEGACVLFVSHDLATVKRLCHRVVWLNAGRLIADGDPDDVVSRYEQAALASLGGTQPASNELGELGPVRLLSSEGTEIGSARVTDESLVAVTFTTRRPGQRARCAIRLSADGIPAFTSVQTEVVEFDEAGIWTAYARLPANLLAETLYTVKAAVVLEDDDGEEHPLARDNALSFRAHDVDETHSARGTYREPMAGLVRPLLEWSVQRSDAPAGVTAEGPR